MRFRWESPKTNVTDLSDQDVSERIKNSAIQICVMGSMCRQFQNALEDRFTDELVHITNDFLFHKEDSNREDETKKLVSTKSGIFHSI